MKLAKLAAQSYHYCGYDEQDGDRSAGYTYTGPRSAGTVYADTTVTHVELRPDVVLINNDVDGASATWDAAMPCPFVEVASETMELRNDFHRSSVCLRVPADGILSREQVARARRVLCGVAGCTCGGNLGERGPQPAPFVVTPLSDGRWKIEVD
jgi:hypothetical protein